MKSSFSLILLIGVIFSCNLNKKDQIKIEIDFYPEDKEYSILEWKDTLGKHLNLEFYERPIELCCTVLNQKTDTIGYYRGLSSSPKNYLYFKHSDAIAFLHFKTEVNIFSEIFDGMKEKDFQNYILENKIGTEYQPIKIILKDNPRQNFKTQLIPLVKTDN